MSNFAKVPNFTKMPSFVNTPSFANIPSFAYIPSFANMPSFAKIPSFANIPSFVRMPKFVKLLDLVKMPRYFFVPKLFRNQNQNLLNWFLLLLLQTVWINLSLLLLHRAHQPDSFNYYLDGLNLSSLTPFHTYELCIEKCTYTQKGFTKINRMY